MYIAWVRTLSLFCCCRIDRFDLGICDFLICREDGSKYRRRRVRPPTRWVEGKARQGHSSQTHVHVHVYFNTPIAPLWRTPIQSTSTGRGEPRQLDKQERRMDGWRKQERKKSPGLYVYLASAGFLPYYRYVSEKKVFPLHE